MKSTATYSLKKIKVIGVSMSVTTCECCGKEDLAKTIKLEDLESGLVMHFGSTCAYKANKFDTAAAAAKAEKEVKSALFFAKAWLGVPEFNKKRSMEIMNLTEDQLFQQYVTTGQI